MTQLINPETIILVIYRRNRPFTFITADGSEYDVEYSRLDGCYYANYVGSHAYNSSHEIYPHSANYWSHPDAGMEVAGDGKRYKTTSFSGDDWFEESDCIWCAECKDWRPTANWGDPCDHITWCDECGDWSTPDEPCPHEDDKS